MVGIIPDRQRSIHSMQRDPLQWHSIAPTHTHCPITHYCLPPSRPIYHATATVLHICTVLASVYILHEFPSLHIHLPMYLHILQSLINSSWPLRMIVS